MRNDLDRESMTSKLSPVHSNSSACLGVSLPSKQKRHRRSSLGIWGRKYLLLPVAAELFNGKAVVGQNQASQSDSDS